MSSLPPTQFSDWTEFGYASFYKRYVAGLRSIARARFRCSPESADALAHSFLAESYCTESGGLLANFDRQARFRSYVASAFYYHCQRQLRARPSHPLPEESLPGPPGDDPAWRVVHDEAEHLRSRVRAVVESARDTLMRGGQLSPVERRYLELKWPADSGQTPLSDREVGRQLVEASLLLAPTPSAEVRAACRLGERVGAQLLRCIRGQLEEEYRRLFPEASVQGEAKLSLNAIVHVLAIEEHSADGPKNL